MKNIKNYEPKFEFRFKENMNIDANSSLVELIAGMGKNNIVDCIRLLKAKYGISYKHIATIMGVSGSCIRTAINHGTFEFVLKEDKLIEGILRIQDVYLQDFFVDIEEIEEVEEAGAGCSV